MVFHAAWRTAFAHMYHSYFLIAFAALSDGALGCTSIPARKIHGNDQSCGRNSVLYDCETGDSDGR